MRKVCKSSRAGLKKREPTKQETDNWICLDREINDKDIWVVMVNGIRIIGGLSDIQKLKRPVHGKVLMQFVDKMGCNCVKFNDN